MITCRKETRRHYLWYEYEPIDLYRSMGILRQWAIIEICQHALRNIGTGKPEDSPVKNRDMEKIRHYAEILKVACGEESHE